MGKHLSLLTALIASLVSLGAYACGDSLYRVGKGVSYRVYSAPLPGNLLVYVNSEGARQMAARLVESGHDVRLVANAEELSIELEKGGYDVVIAPFSQREKVDAAASSTSGSSTTFLPVATGSEDKQLAKKSYGHALQAKANIKQYLKAIHRTLKQKA